MTDPPRFYPSTLGFSRRIRRRYMAPAAEQGQPAPPGEQRVAMGFVRRPIPQVTGLRTPSVASRVIERAVQPALPVAPATTPAARSTDQDFVPASETALWPEEPTQTTVEPSVPFVAVTPEPPVAQATLAGEAPLRRGFTLDEVRRALQRPARTQPSPPPVQREERQPAQSDEGMRPPAQDVQGEPAVARPRPVSRLVEQPQQSVSREPRSQEPLAPSPISRTEASAPTVGPRSTEGTASPQVLPTAIAAEAATGSTREGPPEAQDEARRILAGARGPASSEPVTAPDAGGRRSESVAGELQAATGPATEPLISRAPEEAGERSLAPTVESSDTVPGAMAPEGHVQRAPDVSLPGDVIPPPISAVDGLAGEPSVSGMPPRPSPEARPPLTQVSREVAQPPALSPSEVSEVETDTSDANPFDSGRVTAELPRDAPPETRVGQEIMPESAAREIRRAPTPNESRSRAPAAAIPPVSRRTPTAPEAPGSSVDLASAYRAQLARYAAETQAAAETSGPALGPQSAAPVESDMARLSALPSAMPDESRAEISLSYPVPAGARVTPPSLITGTVRRETWATAQEPTTETEQPLPPSTDDSSRPLQRQTVRLDQALGISSAPTPPPAQPALPVRRSVTQGDTLRAESATEAEPATASPTQAPAEGGPDIEELAERVFAKLRGRLRVERERLGGTRLR